MSFARKGSDSDVYVYEHTDGFFICHWCCLHGPPVLGKHYTTEHIQEMVVHLREHLAAGQQVPTDCITELEAEARGAVSI